MPVPTGSSQANPFACIASGIAALWGPAHGGANEVSSAHNLISHPQQCLSQELQQCFSPAQASGLCKSRSCSWAAKLSVTCCCKGLPPTQPSRPVSTEWAEGVVGSQTLRMGLQAVLRMLEEIGCRDNIPQALARAKDKQDPFRLMGFGHRVYKTFDPRAKVMQKVCHEVLQHLDIKCASLPACLC